ncbi:Ras family small GTPase RAP-1 [Thecamonas trahens ATCC 50062]|uniref:Ras family small GTPase RAP-1 n=1 Tax=Thecamonas trahens ATCC 50062 TaxID=461836 RepID=A0A0L0D195_THETB|nr:Ras family small GTPase RAP-1 [Thecamonas trahens ATCC 50062]KNC46124.1 Ras family small GTPase RAP-1 [Thecamonas trahens ATCC 50062]|eukprot:XP_013763101.1 Ras family small GTPase RAP-1 [Thecamonas trahens ATCC 50062]
MVGNGRSILDRALSLLLAAAAQQTVLGSGSVGKSALTVRFIKGKFVARYDPTIEDSYSKPLVVDDEACMLDILDTAGQEGYSSMLDAYMKSGEGFILVYDVTNQASFEHVDEIRQRIERSLEDRAVCITLVANKIDLEADRVVTSEDGEAKAKLWDADYVESSAKTDTNVTLIFETIVRRIRSSRGGGGDDDTPSSSSKKKGCTLL